MAGLTPPPEFRTISPSMRVDVSVSDWRAALAPELPPDAKEQKLYAQVYEAYLDGDYGFGLWCWHECDRLVNAMAGSVKEVTRVLGPNRYFGFSHRRAVAERVPLERVYRPRKGDMSTPRTDAFVLPLYQLLCVYEVKARAGDARSKALLQIALGESEDRRRADPYMRHYETFRDLLNRSGAQPSPGRTGPMEKAPARGRATEPG